MRDDLDPEIAQVTGRPDAGSQQMRRRMDRARRDDDLAPGLAYAELGLLAIDQRFDPDTSSAFKQQLLDRKSVV